MSMPPVISTSVWPKTSGASSEIWRATFSRFPSVRKYCPVVSAKVTKIATAITAGVKPPGVR